MFVLQRGSMREFVVHGLAYAPDGRLLASTGEGYRYGNQYGFRGQVTLWDLPARRAHGVLMERGGGAHAVAFSPDGRTLAVAGRDKAVRLWDVADALAQLAKAPRSGWRGVPERVCHRIGQTVSSLAFSPDGRWLLVGRGDPGNQSRGRGAILLDPATGAVRATLAPDERVCCVACSADGSTLALGTTGLRALLIDAASLRITGVVQQDAVVRALALSSDGHVLATTAGWSIQLWDVATGRERATLAGHRQVVWALALSPDGRLLASGAGDGVVTFWDAASGRVRTTFDWQLGTVRAVSFAPDGMTAAAGGNGDNHLVIWDVDEG